MQMKCNFPLFLPFSTCRHSVKKNCIFCKWKIVDWNDNTIKALMQQKLFNSPATVTTETMTMMLMMTMALRVVCIYDSDLEMAGKEIEVLAIFRVSFVWKFFTFSCCCCLQLTLSKEIKKKNNFILHFDGWCWGGK